MYTYICVYIYIYTSMYLSIILHTTDAKLTSHGIYIYIYLYS